MILKIQMRLERLSNGLTMDRDMIGAINIGLKYLSTDGRGMAFPSTELHGVQAKLVIPRQRLNPLT
jgi:putative transposase